MHVNCLIGLWMFLKYIFFPILILCLSSVHSLILCPQTEVTSGEVFLHFILDVFLHVLFYTGWLNVCSLGRQYFEICLLWKFVAWYRNFTEEKNPQLSQNHSSFKQTCLCTGLGLHWPFTTPGEIRVLKIHLSNKPSQVESRMGDRKSSVSHPLVYLLSLRCIFPC